MKSVSIWESLASHSYKKVRWKTLWPQHESASSHSIQSVQPQPEERLSLSCSTCVPVWRNAEAIGMGWGFFEHPRSGVCVCVSEHKSSFYPRGECVLPCLSGCYWGYSALTMGYRRVFFFWRLHPAGFLINSLYLSSDRKNKADHGLSYRKWDPTGSEAVCLRGVMCHYEWINEWMNSQTLKNSDL